MPRTSKADAPVELDEPVIEGRYVDLDGYTVGFETHKADIDPAELFRGLPDDRCQCPHWGVVTTAGWSSATPTTTRSSKPATPTTAPPATCRCSSPAPRSSSSARPTAQRHHGRGRREPRSGQGGRPAPGGLTMGTHDSDELAEKMVVFLETGVPPDGLFHPDVFCDFSLPHWRIQTQGLDDVVTLRKEAIPAPAWSRARAPTRPRPASCSSSRNGGRTTEVAGTRANCSVPTSGMRSRSSRSTAPATGTTPSSGTQRDRGTASTMSPGWSLAQSAVEKPSSGSSPCCIANRLAPARFDVPIFV